MTFFDTTRIALHAITTNKSRSLLTMLGVIIGVSAVILLISIGDGIRLYITSQVTVLPGKVFNSSGGFSQESQISAFANNKLRVSDIAELRRLREDVELVVPVFVNSGEMKYQNTTKDSTIVGTEDAFKEIRNLEIAKGRFLSDAGDSRKRVAVLGSQISDDIFQNVDPIGKRVTINGQQFIVIGVAGEIGGSFGGPDFDSYVYIPSDTYQMMFDSTTISQIVIRVRDKERVAESILKIKSTFLRRLEDDEFSVIEPKEILKVIDQILGVLTIGLGGIAAISLVVGGIGIMNIMLVSVTERTREIGLRKAIGATPNQILLQFLIESSLLSVIGGGIGVMISISIALLINQFVPAVVTFSSIALAFGVSVGIGVIFGVAPARRASLLSPIEALRYE